MKNEMIKFVSENFEVIKDNFLKSEMDNLEEIQDFQSSFDDGLVEFNYLIEFLIRQMNVSTAEELIDVINKRSIGVDLDSDEVSGLFNMIKELAN